MDPERQRQIASMGGRAAHASGHAHEWNSEEARQAGHLGGIAAHHKNAAFHHESAAHHHRRAAEHVNNGDTEESDRHGEYAEHHTKNATEHGVKARDSMPGTTSAKEEEPEDIGVAPAATREFDRAEGEEKPGPRKVTLPEEEKTAKPGYSDYDNERGNGVRARNGSSERDYR